ncbi:hypothetical protein CDGHABPJ_00211 [Pseudomonas phage OMKO1]|nr:hypothetical protein CDGHABPJ_00211 [Pseudomonas phage OMKO1]WNV47754.1 hypothetical protein [Pseudomonas phage fMGyn-Pae01]
MQIIVTGVQGTGFTEVATEHNGKRLTWTTTAYSKIRVQDQQRVFQEINDYWSGLSAEAQQHIWNCYVEIRKIMDMAMDPMRIAMSLSYYIKEMYKAMPMNSFRRWLLTIGKLYIPVDIEEVITDDSRYNRPDQTYLKHDYINLASVSLALRPLVPIWGEFIDQGTSQEMHKECEVISLISDCEVNHWPVDEISIDGTPVETAYDKLSAYVKFCVEDEAPTLANLYRGMSSAEVPDILQAKVMVRRLTILPLNDATSHSIVSNMFRYVKSNLNPAERSTADRVNDKRPDKGGIDDDDKTSFIESHKTKQRVTPGDIVAYNLDALDVVKLVHKIDDTVPVELIQECLDCVAVTATKDIYPHQILLAQWVMHKAFPARAFSHINKNAVNHLLAAAQSLMWHWGFQQVAVFMQVELYYSGDHAMSIQPRNSTRIQIKYKDVMDELYPHQRQQRAINGVPVAPVNIAGIAVQSAHASIRSSNWIYHGPDRLFKEAEQVTQNKVLVVPATIKSVITELVIHLGKLNQ